MEISLDAEMSSSKSMIIITKRCQTGFSKTFHLEWVKRMLCKAMCYQNYKESEPERKRRATAYCHQLPGQKKRNTENQSCSFYYMSIHRIELRSTRNSSSTNQIIESFIYLNVKFEMWGEVLCITHKKRVITLCEGKIEFCSSSLNAPLIRLFHQMLLL